MRYLRLLAFSFFTIAIAACSERTPPADNTDDAREQIISKPDSQPQDHTAVSPDSSKNTPGMNIGGK